MSWVIHLHSLWLVSTLHLMLLFFFSNFSCPAHSARDKAYLGGSLCVLVRASVLSTYSVPGFVGIWEYKNWFNMISIPKGHVHMHSKPRMCKHCVTSAARL